MNRKALATLASLVVVLLLLLAVFEGRDRPGSARDGDRFLAGFAEHANDIRAVQFEFPEEKEDFAVRREDNSWVVSARDGHPADFGKLAGFVSALADARILEEKTSNPDNFGQLGVDDPADGGSGTAVTLSGDGFVYEVVVGKPAQRSLRYARVSSETTSFLVDQELDLPDSPDDWLVTDIVDIPASRVRQVVIAHADGETVAIEKASSEDANYSVSDIPAGRELSYASVGNSIAGALANLTFDEVRRAGDGAPTTTATFETRDGLQITVSVVSEDEVDWLRFSAAAEDAEETLDESTAETSDPIAEAEGINQRLGQWQYRIADYKKNLFVRRWEDILKDTDDAE